MAGAEAHGLPRRRLLAAGGFGIASLALPSASRAASPASLTAETSVTTVTVAAAEAGTLRAEWDDSGGFTYDLTYQRDDGTAVTVTGVTSPHEVMPSDWSATDDSATYSVYVTSRQGDTSFNSAPSNVTLTAAAAGGTVTTFTSVGQDGTTAGATYRVHTFTTSGTFALSHDRDVDYLLVGGGGGGGARHGGGGGGGGVITGSTPLGTGDHAIDVGTGGRGMTAALDGASGGASTALLRTATGGGRGGGARHAGADGGSGGGGAAAVANNAFGVGASGVGNDGGSGATGTGEGGYAGGGGGGAGAAGGAASGGGADDGDAGAGGSGLLSSITGTAVRYGGGGGGSVGTAAVGTAGAGGAGGGGAGAVLGWTLLDAADDAPTLAWTLLSHSASSPGDEAAMDALFAGATTITSGRAGLTAQSSSGTQTTNVLNWTSNAALETALGTGDVVSDNFALVVTGAFIPSESGTYWFTLSSDDAADLHIGTTNVASFYGGRGLPALGTTTGSIALTAGTAYPFRVRMQEGAVDDGLRLFWQRPSQRTVSTTTWYQDPAELPGTSPNTEEDLDRLIAAASVSAQGVTTITTGSEGSDAGTNILNWGDTTELSNVTGASVPNSGARFALVVAGTFLPSETGTYTFTLAGDDAVDLSVAGTVIVSHYGTHPAPAVGDRTGTVALTAGVPVRLVARQHQAAGGAVLRVFWRRPSQGSGWHHDADELRGAGQAGTDGLGGGGGAGGFSGAADAAGGSGGDGVVIIRYRHDAA